MILIPQISFKRTLSHDDYLGLYNIMTHAIQLYIYKLIWRGNQLPFIDTQQIHIHEPCTHYIIEACACRIGDRTVIGCH